MQQLHDWLAQTGLDEKLIPSVALLTSTVLLALLCLIVHFVTKQVLFRVIKRLIVRTKSTWDDALIKWKVLDHLTRIAPAIVLHVAAPLAFAGHETLIRVVETVASIIIIVIGMAVIDSLLSAFLDVYERFEISRRVYLKGVTQVLRFAVYLLAIIYILSTLLGKSPLVFFSGLGALTAVLMLVFRDSILGFVAGVQLMSNNLVQRGDWIEIPQYGIDGDVVDVSLMTVTVQNWDKTLASVPTYSLISGSFRNWRGMSESGGRRIKRAIAIDMSSVKFCDEEMLERFKKIDFIEDYIEQKLAEVMEHNRQYVKNEDVLVNGRHLTNLGTFRAYLVAYLRNHPKIHDNMTFLVRHLPPTPQGLPIEIYVFSNDQVWANYEAIQADIFDHILAVLPLFDLRVFQQPSGHDFSRALQVSG